MGDDKITQEELTAILEAAQKRNATLQVSKLAQLEAENAALNHTVTVQHVFMKNGLSPRDRIDDATGTITRAPDDSLEGSPVVETESVAE